MPDQEDCDHIWKYAEDQKVFACWDATVAFNEDGVPQSVMVDVLDEFVDVTSADRIYIYCSNCDIEKDILDHLTDVKWN